MEIISSYPKLSELSNSLVNTYHFKESIQWNGKHLLLPSDLGDGSMYLFTTRSLQFMRGVWSCPQPTVFSSTNSVKKYQLVDFRIGRTGQINSAYLEGQKKYEWEVTQVNGIRFFFPEKFLNVKRVTPLLDKFQRYCYDPNISRLVNEILTLDPNKLDDCIKMEWKSLEFFHTYLQFLNNKDIDRLFCEIPAKHIKAVRHAQYIIDHNFNRNLSIEYLSKKVNLNGQYLKQGFKRVVGCTIKQYCIKLRLEKAKAMVLYDDLPINEISHQVGYSNQGYFIRMYKQVFGLTPLQHRLQRINAAREVN